MFPIRDDNSDVTTTPVVVWSIIVINLIVFVFFQQLGANDHFSYAFSVVPQEILTGQDIEKSVSIAHPVTKEPVATIQLERTPIWVYLTVITSMFMHAGIMHIAGNMWFLWIFGDNIEHRLGHVRFLIFYLLCGIAAAAAQVWDTAATGGNTYIPMLGASGAISGVLGGYIVLFPTRPVQVIIARFITTVPAYVALGMWFLFQLISNMGLGAESGVAYAAHIGGFAAGLLLIQFMPDRRR